MCHFSSVQLHVSLFSWSSGDVPAALCSSLQDFLAQFVLQLGGRAKEFDPNLQSLVIFIKTPVFKGSKSIFWGRDTYTTHQSNCI